MGEPNRGRSSEVHVKAKTEKFLELEVGFTLLTLASIVEAGIEEELGGKVFVDAEVDGVFPLNLRFGIVGEEVDAGVVLDILG